MSRFTGHCQSGQCYACPGTVLRREGEPKVPCQCPRGCHRGTYLPPGDHAFARPV